MIKRLCHIWSNQPQEVIDRKLLLLPRAWLCRVRSVLGDLLFAQNYLMKAGNLLFLLYLVLLLGFLTPKGLNYFHVFVNFSKPSDATEKANCWALINEVVQTAGL